MAQLAEHFFDLPNPLDRVERLAEARDWFIDRAADDEVNMIIAGGWGDLNLCLNWRADLESLLIACSYEFKVPPNRREEVGRLLTFINEELYVGHFDLWRQEGSVLYRNSLVLAGGAEANEAQCETVIRIAIDTCERYFPTFQFAIWAGQTAEAALASSLLETAGEA